jgi:uncharacterized protein involved in exopolysaccharide biosynthesis
MPDEPRMESSPDSIRSPNHVVSLLDVVNLALQHWVLLVVGGITGAAVFVVIALLLPPVYVASTAFIQAEPARGLLSGNLGSLAARIGVGTNVSGSVSLDFLREAVTSRDVLDSVILKPMSFPDATSPEPGTIDLISWFRVHDKTSAKRLDHVRRLILKRMNETADQRSGIVRVSIGLRDPNVAAAFLRGLVERLNDFNLHTRQTSSRANRLFLERRVSEAQAELAGAEDALRSFYEQNRRLGDSPKLIFEEGRLKRKVDLFQQIYLTLSQDLEQARIDEVKDTPVITVIETAQPPVRRSSPRRVLLTLMGLLVGAAIALLLAAAGNSLRAAAQGASPAWHEFEQRVGRSAMGQRILNSLTHTKGSPTS